MSGSERRPRAWPLLLVAPALALACLRAMQIRSAAHQLYSGEAASVGRLQWELAQGTFSFEGFGPFVAEYSYQYFAQGTAALQALAWALSPLFGHSLAAQWAASVLLECGGVLALTWLLSRFTTWPLALLGPVALLFPPKFVTVFALRPFGNHSEFLWVPLLLAGWVSTQPQERRRAALEACLVGAGGAVGFALYRLNALPVAALLVVLMMCRERRRWWLGGLVALSAAAVAALLFASIGLRPWGMGDGALGAMLAERPGGYTVAESAAFALRRGVPASSFGDGGYLHRGLLALCVLAAARSWTPWGRSDDRARRDIARFASLWAALALAFPIVAGAGNDRYFIGAWAAATLCLLVQLGSPDRRVRGAALVLVLLLSLAGAIQALQFVDPGTWDRELPDHDLWFVLELDTLDADELPLYRRIIDEGRGNAHIGRASHFPSVRCPRWPGSGQERPRPSEDHCSGYEPGELDRLFEGIADEFEEAEQRRVALREAGRGIWIRSDRELSRVQEALAGLEPGLAEAVLSGARDEARRCAP